jgi:hypothetical protein
MTFKKKRRRSSPAKKKWYRRTYGGKARYRHSKAKPSLETLIAAGTIPFTPAASGFATMFDSAKGGDWEGIADSLKCGFLGFDPQRNATNFNLIGMINPFDMDHGRFTKMLVFAEIAGRIRRRFAPRSSDLIRKIPFIGRWVR